MILSPEVVMRKANIDHAIKPLIASVYNTINFIL